MTRTAETGLLVAAAVLAAFGVTLVNLAAGDSIDARIGLTFLVMLFAFGALHVAIRRWTPSASTALLPPPPSSPRSDWPRSTASIRVACRPSAVVVAHRCRPHHRSAALPAPPGHRHLRRYRYLFLTGALLLLLLPMLPSSGPLPIKGFEANGSRLWVLIDLGVDRDSLPTGGDRQAGDRPLPGELSGGAAIRHQRGPAGGSLPAPRASAPVPGGGGLGRKHRLS